MFDHLIDGLSQNVQRPKAEYREKDGILRCAVCNAPVEIHLTIPELGVDRNVRCACACGQQQADADRERERQEARRTAQKRCFHTSAMAACTFDVDDRSNPRISDALRRYADRFDEFYCDGKGLLLHGPVGTGKSFFAACVANAVIDQGRTARATNFAAIEGELQANREEAIERLNLYDLLVLDDLGAERNTEYKQELVYAIIDGRYRSGKPFIVTTNLPISEIKSPADQASARIYDRVLQMCFPVEVTGQSRRRREVISTFADMKERLGL